MSRNKTGVMFALPARCVAIAARKNQLCLDAITEIFTNLAIAYQIRDDQADYFGVKKGRKNLSDLNKHKFISYGRGAPSPVFNPDWA